MKELIRKVWDSLIIIIAIYVLISSLLFSSDFFFALPILFFFGVVLFSLGIAISTEYYLIHILKLPKKAEPFASARKSILGDILFLGDSAFIITELVVLFQLAMIETKPFVFYVIFIFLSPFLLLFKRFKKKHHLSKPKS